MGAMGRIGVITTICSDDSNNIYAAGNLYDTGGGCSVMKWCAATSSWGEVGALHASNGVMSICVDDSFNVYAAGIFGNAAGKLYVAKWDHNTHTWGEVGTGIDSTISVASISSLFSDSANHVCAGINEGLFASPHSDAYKWDGTHWRKLGNLNGNDYLHAICQGDSGYVYATGKFTNTDGKLYVAKYDPTTDSWSELGTGSNALNPHSISSDFSLYTLCKDNAGKIYVGGDIDDNNGYTYVAAYGVTYLGTGNLQDEAMGVAVYPNPVHNELIINTISAQQKGQYAYTLYDHTGKVYACGKTEATGETKLDMSILPVGMYVLDISGAKYKVEKR
jgi:hypothetical protein